MLVLSSIRCQPSLLLLQKIKNAWIDRIIKDKKLRSIVDLKVHIAAKFKSKLLSEAYRFDGKKSEYLLQS